MSTNEIIRSDLERLPCFRGVAYVAEGAFGKVFGASYVRNGGEARKVAIKVLPRAHGKYSNVQREILIHNRLIHPHIIQFKTLVLLEDYMGIVMEYADLGNLHQDFVRRHGGHFRDSDIRKLFQQLILAVDYCHRKGVADRDIKLENVLLCTEPTTGQKMLKLADFGYSKNVDKSVARSQVGTPRYMAPEVLKILGDNGTPYDARAADMWSIGVLLFFLTFTAYPFDDDHNAHPTQRLDALYRRTVSRSYRAKIPANTKVHPACLELIHQLLDPNPLTRATIKMHVLGNAWFQQGLPEGYESFNAKQAKVRQVVQREELIIQTVQAALAKYQPEPQRQ